MKAVPKNSKQYRRFCIVSLFILFIIIFMGFGYRNVNLKALSAPEEDEIICLSLRVLIEEAKKHPNNNDVKNLAGIGKLEGYIIDSNTNDIILFGRRSKQPSALTLDDLVVNLRNIWNKELYPYCSLDPKKENILKTQKLMSECVAVTSSEKMKKCFNKLKEAVGPQIVVVGGVPRNSHHAHTMIDADYHMKKVSQGLVKLNSIRSCLDIFLDEAVKQIKKTGEGPSMGASMSRFWFHIGEGEPVFQQGDGILYLSKCSVVVLTEKQKATADGELYDSNEEDPNAETFARELSEHFREVALIESSYANLEYLYRLHALLKAIYFQDEIEKTGLNINFFLRGYKYQMESKMPASLPGLANYKEYTSEETQGQMIYTYTLFPMVCGGVDMEIPVSEAQFIKIEEGHGGGGDGDTTGAKKDITFRKEESHGHIDSTAIEEKKKSLAKLEIKKTLISSRPSPESLYWVVKEVF
jgi:hypothetical protein